MKNFARLPARAGGTVTAVLFATTLMTAGAFAQDCKPKHEFTTMVPGTLTVAVVSVLPTVELKDGKIGGFEGLVLNEFARMECLKVEGQEISGAGIIPAVQAKRVDIATGGWYRSERRKEIVALSYPTMVSKMAVIAKTPFKSYADVKGKPVGTPQGNLWVEEAQAYYGDDLKIYQSFDQVFADLRAGRIEAGLVPYELAKKIVDAGTVPGAVFTVPEGIPEISTTLKAPQAGFPAPLGNEAFMTALDADIKEMHESGFIKKALEESGIPGELGDTGEPYFIK